MNFKKIADIKDLWLKQMERYCEVPEIIYYPAVAEDVFFSNFQHSYASSLALLTNFLHSCFIFLQMQIPLRKCLILTNVFGFFFQFPLSQLKKLPTKRIVKAVAKSNRVDSFQ